LGKHEIATVQTTEIDKEAALIRLTTVLAHSSGEWMSSDWPVCPVSETASPHRMGAALTYARRYALFTLVGIAGEDDLDAPELPQAQEGTGNVGSRHAEKANGSTAPAAAATARHKKGGSHRSLVPAPAPLPADQSTALKERLLSEVAALKSADAASWARDAISVKNSLTAADAKVVEEAFARRLADISKLEEETDSSLADTISTEAAESRPDALSQTASAEAIAPPGSKAGCGGIDKSALAIGEPRRHRNKEHLRFVAKQACLVCGREHCDPHHLAFMQVRALGRRVSDEFVVPLCRIHHREVHRSRDERAWWEQLGIDPLPVARKLWSATRLDDDHGQLGDKAKPSLSAEVSKPGIASP
jgi:hypothetical protein